jgi:four helix bundle protein
LLLGIKAAGIRDAKLRDEALRAAKSTVLDIAEGAGRLTQADKRRAFTIARGEAHEAFAALEVAVLAGDTDQVHLERCSPAAHRLYALLTGLVR